MKNLKVYNAEENTKGKSYKITKKVLELALVATSVLSFAGCSSKKQFILQDTLLEGTVVATVSTNTGYETRILRPVNHENTEETEVSIKPIVGVHQDYIDVVTGEFLTTTVDACDNQITYNGFDHDVRDVEEISIKGSVFSFLTEEELKYLNEGKEDEVDFVNILVRIREQEEAKKKLCNKNKD